MAMVEPVSEASHRAGIVLCGDGSLFGAGWLEAKAESGRPGGVRISPLRRRYLSRRELRTARRNGTSSRVTEAAVSMADAGERDQTTQGEAAGLARAGKERARAGRGSRDGAGATA